MVVTALFIILITAMGLCYSPVATAHIKADRLPPNAATTQPEGGVNTYPRFSPSHPQNQSAQEPNSAPFTINPAQAHINLLDIETRRQVFSPVILSPNRRLMAFSEVLYYPHNEQIFSSLFMQPLGTPPRLSDTHSLPEAYYAQRAQEALQARQQVWEQWLTRLKQVWPFGDGKTPSPEPIQPIFDPQAPNSLRREIYRVGGIGEPKPTPLKYADYIHNVPDLKTDANGNRVMPDTNPRRRFETLTPVDFSADGHKLLFKHQSGTLYEGLLITQLLVFDVHRPDAPAVDMYPQLHQAVDHYWATEGITPPLTEQAWDVVPLGWVPGSNTEVETKAWAYTDQHRIFLGHWRLNIDTGQPQLLSLMDHPVAVAANGAWVNIPASTVSRF